MKKGCSEIYLSPQPFQVLTFKFLHSYCFIERFFAEEFHGAFCHLAAFVGSAFYDAFLPVEGNAEFFGFLLAGIVNHPALAQTMASTSALPSRRL